MSRRIAAADVAFARSANPNHAGSPHWPAYTRNGATMVFDNVRNVRQGLEADGLALIERASFNNWIWSAPQHRANAKSVSAQWSSFTSVASSDPDLGSHVP